MLNTQGRELLELHPEAQAVGYNQARRLGRQGVHQVLSQFPGAFVKVSLKSHDAGHPAAVELFVDGCQCQP